MSEDERDEFGRFESLARKLVNTPKPKSSAEAPSAGEPAANSSEREKDSGDGD